MARARSIGNVYAELSVKDKMTIPMKKAGKSVDALGSKFAAFSKKAASIGKSMALAAPAAAMAGIAMSMKSAIDAGGELNDMMTRTGADGAQLFIIGQAFKNAGMEAGGVADAVNRMQRALVENGKAFENLGMNVAELKGMDPALAFRSIAENIAKIEDPAERTTAAMEIFGRSGAEMLAVLNDPEAFTQAEKQVGKLGRTLADNAQNLDKVGDSMAALHNRSLELGTGIAVGLMPELEALSVKLGEGDLVDAGQRLGVALGHAPAIAGMVGDMAKLTLPYQVGNAIQAMMPNTPSAAVIAQQRKESDELYAKQRILPVEGVPAGIAATIPASLARPAMPSWRTPAPFVGGAKDREILDQIKKGVGILEQAQTNGGLTW